MMSSGEIVRQIRLTKGLKTKNLYRGLMAQPTSSQYERGKKEIKISKLLIIIARLNLDLEEFVYLFERENDEFALYEKYHQRLLKAFKNKALMEVCLIHQNISNLTESNRLSRFNNLGLLASCMLKKLEAKSESFAAEKELIIAYLMGVKVWSKYEYQFFDEALFIFNENDICQLINASRSEEICDSQNFTLLGQVKVKLLADIIIKLIRLDSYSKNKRFFSILNNVKSQQEDLYSKCYKSFITGLDLIAAKQFVEGTKLISTTLSFCQDLGLFALEQELTLSLKYCLVN
ncbi:hypothetical protein [Liquorilactobacillus nagelii]|uniref:Rgg family transcriptional regulator n=1 Tax=Liquorilactobacillus nagelii TaxID=82688 RepID=UPI001CCF09A2|nr:hypothetical protein [Liquorilactobacillus nagelii]ULQ49106.1 hypothetical protein J6864_09085 [Liquorilactobacillus nagelii]